MGRLHAIVASATILGLSIFPLTGHAQVTPGTFQASTPGWLAMTNASLDAHNSNYHDFNPDGPVVKVWDLRAPNALPTPAIWPLGGFTPTTGSGAQLRFVWSGRNLGQVFGLAIDHNPKAPYIYASATAIYGSWDNAAWPNTDDQSCVTEAECYPGQANLSAPASVTSAPFNQSVVAGLFAPPIANVPAPVYGAVWRLSLNADLSTTYDASGTYELVAAIPSNAMSLGQIAHNPDADKLYVSNFADGLIYIFTPPPVGGTPVTSGFVTFDHGAIAGVPEASPRGLFTAYGRRVWGIQYNSAERRLYYAVWNADFRFRRRGGDTKLIHNQIWSVNLDANGHPITGTAVLRVDLPVYPHGLPPAQGAFTQAVCSHPNGQQDTCYSQPVADIAFNGAGDVMLLAERGERIGRVIGGGYDTTAAGNDTLPHHSRILRYRKNPASGTWVLENKPPAAAAPNDAYGQYDGDATSDYTYSSSNGPWNRFRTNSTGGVDFGYGYALDRNGRNTTLSTSAPDAWAWTGANSYRTLACVGLNCRLVYGFQGAELATVPNAGPNTQINQTPKANLYFIDFDGDMQKFPKGMLGDVEVQRMPPSTLKICKVAGAGVSAGQAFGFLAPSPGARPPLTVPAGPGPGGWCKVAGTYPGGTTMTVNEAAVTGIAVTDIRVEPASAQTGPADLAGGKVEVTLVPGGVTEVTFTNARPTGYLEICKAGDVTGVYTFSTNGTDRINVPAGACSSAIEVPAGPVKIKELTPGAVMAACSTLPANRQLNCSPASGVSVVTVIAGGIASQTIATITNAKADDRTRPEEKK